MLAPNGPHDKTPPKKRTVSLGDLIAGAVQPAVQKARQVEQTHPRYVANQQAQRAVNAGVQRVTQVARNVEHAAGGHTTAPRHPIHGSGQARTIGSNSLLGNIGAELNGTGTITAGAIPALGRLAAAGINLPHTITSHAPGILRVPLAAAEGPLGIVTRAAPHLLGNAARDAIEIPGEAIPSMYYALKPLVHGDVSTTVSRFGQPYVDLVKHPGKSVMAHPLGSALLVAGAEGALGRTAGRVGRSGVLGRTAQRATSLDRGVATLPGSTLTERRFYSKDAAVQAAQKHIDARGVAKADRLRAQADRIEQNAMAATSVGEHTIERAQNLRAEANRIDPRVISSDKSLKTRLNETQDANVGLGRQNRTAALAATSKIVGRKTPATFRLLVEGTIKANAADLRAHIGELSDAHARMAEALRNGDAGPEIKGRMKNNEQLRSALQKDLANVESGKLNLHDLKQRAEQYATLRNSLDEKLAQLGLIDKAQAERRRLLPAAVRNLGLKYDEKQGFVDAHGTPVSTEQIRQQIAHPDRVAEPAFLSQAPNARGAGNFWRSSSRPAQISSKKFTGTATLEGTYSAHPEVLRESVARAQTLIDQQQGFARMMDELGGRHKVNGQLVRSATYSKAVDRARALHESGSPVEWVPIRLNPFGGSKAQLAKFVEGTTTDPAAVHSSIATDLQHTFQEAVDGQPKGSEAGPWGLIPKPVAQEMLSHTKMLGPNDMFKLWQKVNSLSRRVVLLTPHFVEQNVLEATLRGALKGALPVVTRSYWTGLKLLKELEKANPEAHAATMERGVGVGNYGFAERSNLHRPLGEGTGKVSRAIGAAKSSEAGHKVVNGWDHLSHFVFSETNGRLEQQFRTALAGKYARDYLLPKDGLRLSHDAMQQAVQGLTNTHEQVALGRYVDRAYGKYGKFSPEARRFLTLYTPFGAWIVNATRFIYSVLPRDHPVVASLIAASSQTSADWRKQHGLTQFNAKGVKRVPGFLQNTIPGANGSHLRGLTQGTPFGLMSDVGSSVSGQFLPTTSGVLDAFAGRLFTGRQIQGANGQPGDILDYAKQAALEGLGITVPGFNLYEQQRRAGGSIGNRARRLVDPFQFTQSKQKTAKTTAHPAWGAPSSAAHSGWGSGSGTASSGWGTSP